MWSLTADTPLVACAGTSLTAEAGELSRSMGRIVMYEIKHINIEVILRNRRAPPFGSDISMLTRIQEVQDGEAVMVSKPSLKAG